MKEAAIIEKVRGQKLTIEERCQMAIDLAASILQQAHLTQTRREKEQQSQISRMMNDPSGKVFTTAMTDQGFRSAQSPRVASQISYLVDKFGIPKFLATGKRIELWGFRKLACALPGMLVPLARRMLRKETSTVILPGEEKELAKHMQQRKKEGVRINLNHLGEAILGEEEAKKRLNIYLHDLAKPDVDYISVKISTICSQINLLAWDQTVDLLAERLRELYRAAGTKFVNLDMEEYRDLHLTVELFKKVLDEAEFFSHSAGIVLQAYLPDSYLIQQELTIWAMQRVAAGGAPIKIRIVKGANLAMEQVEAALRGWEQAPYHTKGEVDANYKRMVTYGCQLEHAKATRIGVASHNLFDIAYALLMRAENKVEDFVEFEMLEGMADPMRRIVQKLAGGMLLYCPAATEAEFQNAVAYLVRRLDENTAPDNFLRHAFQLIPGSPEWKKQAALFEKSCLEADKASFLPNRTQNRLLPPEKQNPDAPFTNEADTDWSLPQNRKWARMLSATANEHKMATWAEVDQALNRAKSGDANLPDIAHEMRLHRGKLIASMVANTGKTIPDADVEVSEAIDFAEYYHRSIKEWKKLPDIRFKPKGIVLITPPWNFPCSIPAGGILAALATGNSVIFKPAKEAMDVGFELVKLFWQAGVSKEALQFITCEDDPVGSKLIQDKRVQAVVLTGATSTAKLMLRLRPGLDLMAETGGKNAMIITSMADRDLAIKELIHSAFGHAGQKCSACSLAILDEELYDNAHFLQQLADAAASLPVGAASDPATRVNPLIHAPSDALLRGLTTLDEGESWLLEPKQKSETLWTPGIKLGVKAGSFMHQTELFGPVLGIMRAKDLEEAITLANGTPYGLTSGIHSLDDREQKEWLDKIEAGNCYINRSITGAIVQRQPFGGCKESSFGKGSKAGGPNYLTQFMIAEQINLPQERESLQPEVEKLEALVKKEERAVWRKSVENYTYWWNRYFSKDHDPSAVRGEDNILKYLPQKEMFLRVQPQDRESDLLRIMAAAMICGTPLHISKKAETEEQFIEKAKGRRVRLLSLPSAALQRALAENGCTVLVGPVLANGRLELLNYLREVSISYDYHRYGNLGERELESRAT